MGGGRLCHVFLPNCGVYWGGGGGAAFIRGRHLKEEIRYFDS